MYGKIQICNRALRLLKLGFIESFEDETKEARHCKFLYPIIKREVISMYPWKIALRSAKLMALYNGNAKLEYKHKYLLPRDCLNILSLDTQGGYIRDAQYLYGNNEVLNISYIANLEEEDLGINIPRLIALRLAQELACGYFDNMSMISFLKNSFQEEYLKLTSTDYKDGDSLVEIKEDNASWIASRH